MCLFHNHGFTERRVCDDVMYMFYYFIGRGRVFSFIQMDTDWKKRCCHAHEVCSVAPSIIPWDVFVCGGEGLTARDSWWWWWWGVAPDCSLLSVVVVVMLFSCCFLFLRRSFLLIAVNSFVSIIKSYNITYSVMAWLDILLKGKHKNTHAKRRI